LRSAFFDPGQQIGVWLLGDYLQWLTQPEGAGCVFVNTVHPSAHIEICAGGWNAGDGTTGKKDSE
jgi:hypothetical protein